MEKVYTLLWILLAIGVFVFRMIAKMRETSARESQERPQRPGGAAPEMPATTFQEMLRQMQSRNAGPVSPEPAVPQAQAPRTPGGRRLPRELAQPTLSQERTTARQASLEAPATARGQHMTAPLVRRSSAMPRASAGSRLEAKRPATSVNSAENVNETVRNMLRQPESVRAAFVLSEIFQRKY